MSTSRIIKIKSTIKEDFNFVVENGAIRRSLLREYFCENGRLLFYINKEPITADMDNEYIYLNDDYNEYTWELCSPNKGIF